MSRKTALPHETLLLPGATGEPPGELPEYGWDEILRHNTARDLWLVVGGHVYNVGEFLFHHPGGAEVLLAQHGRDATAAFLKIGHPDYALALTRSFLIGRLRPGSPPPAAAQPPREPPPREAPAREAHPTQAHPTQAPPPEAHPTQAPPPEAHPTQAPAREIPVAIKKLRLNGERFVNFDILNDVRSQLHYCRRFGHIYQAKLPGRDGRRLVVVSDAELLDEVAGNADQFGKQVEGINFFKQLALARGSGISVVSDSPFYQRVRRIMIPWYSPAHQRTQFELMKEVARRTVAAWQAMADDTPIDMRDWMTRYAMEISGRGACSYDFGLLAPDARPGELAAGVPTCLRNAIARVVEPAPDAGGLFAGERMARARAFHAQVDTIFREADRIVATRQRMRLAGPQTDLLARLLSEADPETGERLNSEVIADQLLMHLSNGFNGPSVTLSWIPVLLSQHPAVEARLIAEIDAIAGGDPDYDMQYADLLGMTYATQVIKETLRRHPPMPVTIRNSLADGRLGPWRMRKGDIVLVAALAAHLDPRHWGPDPEAFDPDNFAVEKVATRARHAFIPFSVGERQCMAQEVTFMMLRVALFQFYNAFRLRLAPGAQVVTRAVVTMGPVAVPVLRERREDKAARQAALAERAAAAPPPPPLAPGEAAMDRAWDVPSAIPVISPFGHATIAFGSNFGVCRDLAEQLGEKSRRFGFTQEILPLNALAETPAPTRPWLLLVCTATYTGNPPSNANRFKAWLERETPGSERWRHCRFVVFGLGNSQWVAFQRFPRFVHARLLELGATPVADPGSADVGAANWREQFARWCDQTWPRLIELAGARPSETAARAQEAEQAQPRGLAALPTAEGLAASLDGSILAPVRLGNALDLQPIQARVLAARELHAPGAPGGTRHIELELPEGFDYRVGDHVGVCPRNDAGLVARLARQLEAPLDGLFRVPEAMRRVRCVPRGVVLQVGNTLTQLVDFAGPISAPLLAALHECAGEPAEQAMLGEMARALGGADGVADSRAGKLLASRFNVVELLELFPSVRLGFFRFLEAVPSLRPRYYSASSSPAFHGERVVHITVGRLETPLSGPGERRFRGLCSHYLHAVPQAGTLDIFLDKAEGFGIQDDLAAPMIMVSAGTGFAPMRAFLFERLARRRLGAALGPALVFNGIRSPAADLLYGEELAMFEAQGVLDGVHLAISRPAPARCHAGAGPSGQNPLGQNPLGQNPLGQNPLGQGPSARGPSARGQYVQHKLLEQAGLVWELLSRGGYVFICGSTALREAVRAAFVRIAGEQGGMTAEAAEAHLTRLEQVEHRYRPDVWG
jgi:cytochrome P450/NADPH-cytochrome P450 reductase